MSPPTGRNHLVSRTVSKLDCTSKGSSPISSRNNTPSSACFRAPARPSRASVKAPLTWPNSSEVTSVAGIAPQFRATNGRSASRLRRWIEAATIPLPVPVSPRIRVLMTSVEATGWAAARIHRQTRCIASVRPTTRP